MGTLVEKQVVSVAQIKKFGTAMIIPEGMTWDQSIELLQRRKVYEEEVVQITRKFDVFPWDGAVALDRVLKERYGWSPAVGIPGMFSTKPPELKAVEVAPGVIQQIPWGRFIIPNTDADVYTQFGDKDGRIVLQMLYKGKRKWQDDAESLFEALDAEIKKHSIYKGQAFKLDFERQSQEGIVEPQFIDTRKIDPSQLILSEDVEAAVETSIYTPLKRYKDLPLFGLTFKRGIGLTGTYGTGKTLAARISAKYAVDANITFVDCLQPDYLGAAVAFARMYQPAVIFCEDVDRSLSGDRTADMDEILNIVDGIDSKNTDIMVVITSNAVEKINPAMIRPGRLDAVIHVTPPDAAAVSRLLRHYGAGVIDSSEDLGPAAEQLAGHIPAVIEEVVKRSKLAALKRLAPGQTTLTVDSQALLESAKTMKMQLDLLYRKEEKEVVPTIDAAFRGMVREIVTPEFVQMMTPLELTKSQSQSAANHSYAARTAAVDAKKVVTEMADMVTKTAEVTGKVHRNVKTFANRNGVNVEE